MLLDTSSPLLRELKFLASVNGALAILVYIVNLPSTSRSPGVVADPSRRCHYAQGTSPTHSPLPPQARAITGWTKQPFRG